MAEENVSPVEGAEAEDAAAPTAEQETVAADKAGRAEQDAGAVVEKPDAAGEAPAAGAPDTHLRKSDLMRSFLIWETTSESCLSYERLMSLGFCHAMTPIINRLYHTKEERAVALKRHMAFFNTENNWGAFIPGIVASMEEDMANGGATTPEAIENVKLGLMGPLAGIGDTITQGLVRTIILAICVDMVQQGNFFGPWLAVACLAVYIGGIGYTMFTQGYRTGEKILAKISDSAVMGKITNCLSILGLTIAGAMIMKNVGITTPLTFDVAGSSVVIQDILNSIAPGILNLGFVLGSFAYLKRGGNVFKLMVALIAIAIVASLVGVL